MPTQTITRTCRICQQPTPLNECVRNPSSKDGRANLCIPCKRIQSKTAYARSKMTRQQWREEARYVGETQPCTRCGVETVGDAYWIWKSQTNGRPRKVFACLTCWDAFPQIARDGLMGLAWSSPRLVKAIHNERRE